MTITEAIPLLTSIAALLAAFIALFTLFELSKQRKSSYKPDLSILQNMYRIKQNETSELNLALDWIEVSSEEAVLGEKVAFNKEVAFSAQISVVNIGFGAAKGITANWSFEKDKLIDEVNRLAQKTHQSFYLEKENHMLTIKNKGNSSHSIGEKTHTEHFKYLLPLTHDNNGRKLSLPLSYKMLVSTYLSLATFDEISFQKISIPDLKLKLKYFDIGKGKHETTHNISCNLTSTRTDKNSDGDFSSYEFSVNLLEKSQET